MGAYVCFWYGSSDACLCRINLNVQSVVKYIPNGEQDNSEFLGVEALSAGTFKNTNKKQDDRSRQIEVQRIDAATRRVIWDAEDTRLTDADAEGEIDPDFANDSGVELVEPLGVRTNDGRIRPLTAQEVELEEAMEVDSDEQFFGKPDFEPERVGQLVGLIPPLSRALS